MDRRKSFTVNGRIHPSAKHAYYFVDPSKSNQEIIESISKEPGGHAIMLYGARGIGKSTRVARLVEQLSDRFFCISLSLQSGIEVRNPDTFWSSFGQRIQRGYPDLPPVRDRPGLAALFSLSNQEEKFGGKPAVLLVDEFDLLYDAPPELLEAILSLFRDLKQEYGQTSCLQALVGVGPFSILKLSSRSSSPFNISDSLSTKPFTKEDVQNLFQEYSENAGIPVEQRIIDDIYSRTNGHAGLTCFCGKQLDEVLLRGRTRVTFEEWIQFCVEKLVPSLRTSWATMARLVERILELPSVCATLARYFLRTDSMRSVGHDLTLLQHAEFLTAEGVLVRVEGSPDTFEMASPLVRHLCLWALQGTWKKVPKGLVPTDDDILLIPKLIEMALPCFSETMKEAPMIANKKSRNRGTKRDSSVPHEACYHFELFNILTTWIHPLGFRVFSEANAPLLLPEDASSSEKKTNSSRRCDLYIKDDKEHYALEIMASSEEFETHIQRAEIYGKSLNAQHIWVLNFFTSKQEPTFPVVEETRNIPILHICHDCEWTWAQVCVNGCKPQPVVDLIGVENLRISEKYPLIFSCR